MEAPKKIIAGDKDNDSLPHISLGQIFYNILEENSSQTAVINPENNKEISYSDLLKTAIKLAKQLRKLGINRREIISIIAENCWESIAILFAAFFIDVTVNMLNFNYTAREIKDLTVVTNPKIIFCTNSTLKNTLSAKINSCPIIININGDKLSPSSSNRILLLKNLLLSDDDGDNDDTKQFAPVEVVDPEKAIAVILTSSGTTGLPKAVMVSHANLRISMLQFQPLLSTEKAPESPYALAYLPIFHIYGLIVAMAYILYQRKMIILEKFAPSTFLTEIQKRKIDHLFVVPPVAIFLSKTDLVETFDLSSIKTIISGSAVLTRETYKRLEFKFGKGSVLQAYGMTETTGFATLTPRNSPADKAGSVGKASISHELVVCDAEGNYLGPNEVGEVRIRGGGITPGYLKNKQATEDSFDENSFIKTGDLGYYDDDHYFFINGRLKEVIKYKGFQVSPSELESVLLEHEAVEDAAVIGIEHERSGEVPLAFVVRKPACQGTTAEEIVQFVNENVSVEKRLSGGLRFVGEIPKNAGGKILRQKLKELVRISE